ncbi:T9SS type A sorting domain-containing protein [Bacteroidota bacterium]
MFLLKQNEFKAFGTYQISFDTNKLPNGTYFYKLYTTDKILTRKMVICR